MSQANASRTLREFIEIMQTFKQAMLVTQRGSELRSRPMAIADLTSDGRVRFITRDDSGKLAELDENSNVNVSLQGQSRYLSISGVARLTKDRKLIERTWQEHQGQWFEEGRDDPHIMLLEILPTYIEYWDRSDAGFISQIFELTRDALLDEESDSDQPGKHGKLDLADASLSERGA